MPCINDGGQYVPQHTERQVAISVAAAVAAAVFVVADAAHAFAHLQTLALSQLWPTMALLVS